MERRGASPHINHQRRFLRKVYIKKEAKEAPATELAYKFRLYPTPEQAAFFERNFGCARFVYNHFLAERIKRYKESGKSSTRFEQDKELTQLKRELEWLQEVDSRALKSVLSDLDQAYQNFFRRLKNGEKPGFPQFKRKRDNAKRYRTTQNNGNIKVLKMQSSFPSAARSNAAYPEKSKAASSTLRSPKRRAGSISYHFAARMLRLSLCIKPAKLSASIWALRISLFRRMAKSIRTRSILQNMNAVLRSFSVSSPEKQRGAPTGTRRVSRSLVCTRKYPTAAVTRCRNSPHSLFEKTM